MGCRYALGALDSEGDLSRPLGRRMAALPLHPMYAKVSSRIGGADPDCLNSSIHGHAMVIAQLAIHAV